VTAEHAGVVPAALSHRFTVAVTVASFLFWLVLGVSTGCFYRLFQPAEPASVTR
jgi:predicted cobalt transporter CbtA